MVTSVSINQGGRFGKHAQRLGERKVQAELTEKQMQVSILEELWQLWILLLLFTVPDLGSTIPESGEVLNFQHMKVHLGVSENGGFSPQIIHFNRVFHYFHHPFWGFSPYFWKHPSESDQHLKTPNFVCFSLWPPQFRYLHGMRDIHKCVPCISILR